jgi:two-component system, OmpR family, phosphate regulon response regulator OmpR
MSAKPHLLVVDDDARIRDLLRQFLQRKGYAVTLAGDAQHARSLMSALSFDLVVLDVMMPGEDGLQLTRAIRAEASLPIILLTARGLPEDRIEGLRVGADDYLPKPFEPEELALRIDAVLRRARAAAPLNFVTFGGWRLNAQTGEVEGAGGYLALSTTEQAILIKLARHVNTPVARHELAEACGSGQERSIDVAITRLRKKLAEDPREPRWLQTVRGSGYRLIGFYDEAGK